MALPHAFSLQDASLLSGIEPLPLSSPTSPRRSLTNSSSPPPVLFSPSDPSLRRSFSSEVTAQLYASLRRSREADQEEAEKFQRTPGPQVSTRGLAMATEVDDLADEMERRLQEGVEASGPKEPSPYISQMESLRYHLKNMLTLSDAVTSHGDASEKRLEQESDSTSTLLSAYPGQDLSPPLSLAGLEGLFPRYSTLYNAAPSLPDLHLRDALEKETTRRKHLERHIQKLQNEMLELQQRVSVTVAADRRKDTMIQQLDQTLALVVGGWKQQEQQREETLRHLRREKEEAEQARSKDQETLTQVRKELAQAHESLSRDSQAAEERQRELQRLAEEQAARVSQLQAECEAGEEARADQRRELESLHHRMQEQQRSWAEREQELQEESRRLQEEGRRELEKEKALTQQETQKSQQWQLALSSLQGEVLRLERELQASYRERDTLQMELNLEKARNESEKVRLESEHKMRLEETVAERLTALHEESAQHLCTVREQHRRQLLDLTSQHETELSNQLSQFKSELQERERRHREVIMDYELQLSRSDERCQELSRAVHRLEIERAQKLSQLQDVMKSHWSQALQVLTAKDPSEGSSLVLPAQQTDPDRQWPFLQTRDGGYGETSDQTRLGAAGAGNSIGRAGSNIVTDRSSQNTAGGSHLGLSRNQHAEDSDGTTQQAFGSGQLAQNSGSDLINFTDNQNIVHQSHLQEPSPRFFKDGNQISNKAMMANDAGGLSYIDGCQSRDKVSQKAKVPATADSTCQSLLNSGSFQPGGPDKPQQSADGDSSRKYTFGDYIKEPYGQSVMVIDQNPVYSEKSRFNIASCQYKNSSGHSDSQSQPVMLGDDSGRNLVNYNHILEEIRQSMMDRQNILNLIGSSQFGDLADHSFAISHSQPTTLRDSRSSQNPDTRAHAKEEVSQPMIVFSHQKDIGSLNARTSHHQAPVIVPHLSHIYKESNQGHSRQFGIQSGHQEDSIGSHRPSRRVTDHEERFYPMQVEDLSHSFGSHHGFFPLEPQADSTMTGTVSTTFAQTSPEHPLQEEIPQNWRAGEDRATPNPVLQYYIRMLLDRTPGDPLNEQDKSPDMSELCQYLLSTENQTLHRLEEHNADVSKLESNPKKQAERKAPVAVRKEVLSSQRRPNPAKPLKRVSARGGRPGVWK
ncbi:centrobin [Pseudophryne corroboree]|uniref:centrobin n=1 Tax=Pseudophryne corroboree TaxID=495146 RepID=UPI003081BE0E